jgi:hypothetical protein
MGFRMPFDSPMPGIMFHLDAFEKKIVDAYFENFDKAPKWLKQLDCDSVVDFPTKMTQEFPKYDITLVGMPDAVFGKTNGKLCLVDYKSATYKGDDDPFMPSYVTQLLGYTHLLESNGIGEVDSAALVYFENKLKEHETDPIALLSDDGFEVPFEVKIHEVKVDRPALFPLLKKIRGFADKYYPPTGLDKCKNCARLQALLDAEERMLNYQEEGRKRDDLYRKVTYPALMQDKQKARNAWNFDVDEEFICISPEAGNSLPASWDV